MTVKTLLYKIDQNRYRAEYLKFHVRKIKTIKLKFSFPDKVVKYISFTRILYMNQLAPYRRKYLGKNVLEVEEICKYLEGKDWTLLCKNLKDALHHRKLLEEFT